MDFIKLSKQQPVDVRLLKYSKASKNDRVSYDFVLQIKF